ncbi:MAG TPA: MASE3 domain-containing protein [Clostridia bacterium]|nr:MASE3 domain-containing protein [Clostridia bacterium]
MRSKSAMSRVKEYKHLAWLFVVAVVSAVLFENLYLFEPLFSRMINVSEYLSWHTIFEFISILVSLCVFILPYYTYRQNHRLRGILIANVFLTTGIIDTFHTLSFKGMPFFFVENSTADRATTFWIIARLIGAIGLTSVSFIKIHRKSNADRRAFFFVSILFSLSVFIIVTYFPNILPVMYDEAAGVTQIKKLLEYVVIAFLCFAGIMYLQQYLKKRDNSNLLFSIAIIASIFSELAFVRYNSVYDIYNYAGHAYKFISYFIIFRVAFVNNVERPYMALYKAIDKLKKYTGNLNRLVAQRTEELQNANHNLNLMNEKLLDDLEYARDIQKSILPDNLPDSDQVAFEARYYPAERVGGDFYNVFNLDEHRIGMYIGDVSGHGVPAAMLTVFLNQSIKTTKELDGNRFEVIEPSKVLKNLYELYNKINFKDEVYILVLYAVYDAETGELTYSSAGMNAKPLVVKSSGEVIEMDIAGLPICKLMNISPADYTDRSIRLDTGDRVFFYTDGLIELKDDVTGEAFTADHLKELLSASDISSSDLYGKIDSKIRRITENGGLTDDATFFMLRVN